MYDSPGSLGSALQFSILSYISVALIPVKGNDNWITSEVDPFSSYLASQSAVLVFSNTYVIYRNT